MACAAQVDPRNATYPELPLAWEKFFRCSLNDSADIPLCSTDYAKRDFDTPCRCTGQENFTQIPPDVSKVFLVGDPLVPRQLYSRCSVYSVYCLEQCDKSRYLFCQDGLFVLLQR